MLTDSEAEPSQDGSLTGEIPGLGFGDFLRMILVLGGLIALIYGFFWFLKRFSGVRTENEDILRILAVRGLKGEAALHLVEAGNRIFLVGSASGGVNLIAEIDDKETVDGLLLQAARTPRRGERRFLGYFQKRFASPPGEGDTSAAGEKEDPADFLRSQRQRVKDL